MSMIRIELTIKEIRGNIEKVWIINNRIDYDRSTFVPTEFIRTYNTDRKSTRLNSSHIPLSRMPSSA